jgi:N-acetylglucosamine malate deacetylase 2
MERQRQILVVLPHPDDEAGMAGTLAAHIHNGTPVTYICLTLGQMGRNMGNPPFATRVTLPLVRKAELEQSCQAIGIQDLRMWGLHDKTIEFEDREALTRRLLDVIEEIKPSLIMTFHPELSVHPDHNATGALVIGAVKRLLEDDRPTVHCVAFAKGCEEILGPPDVVNDVSRYYGNKIGSLNAHRSQFQIMVGNRSFDDPEVKARFSKERFWTYK